MTPTRGILLGLSLFALGAACQKASEELDAKRMPQPPPPESADVPAALRISVSIDGIEAEPVDAAKLDATQPSFVDEERRAWLLRDLLGPAAMREGVVFAVSAATGPEVLLRPGKGDKDPQPVLLLSRRGEPVATLVSPEEPFPNYHGMGGRLRRRGDPVPRVEGFSRIRIYVGSQE
jgi:hypothetical protein